MLGCCRCCRLKGRLGLTLVYCQKVCVLGANHRVPHNGFCRRESKILIFPNLAVFIGRHMLSAFSSAQWKSMKGKLENDGHKILPVSSNLVDLVWDDQPDTPTFPVIVQPAEYSGEFFKSETTRSKCECRMALSEFETQTRICAKCLTDVKTAECSCSRSQVLMCQHKRADKQIHTSENDTRKICFGKFRVSDNLGVSVEELGCRTNLEGQSGNSTRQAEGEKCTGCDHQCLG